MMLLQSIKDGGHNRPLYVTDVPTKLPKSPFWPKNQPCLNPGNKHYCEYLEQPKKLSWQKSRRCIIVCCLACSHPNSISKTWLLANRASTFRSSAVRCLSPKHSGRFLLFSRDLKRGRGDIMLRPLLSHTLYRRSSAVLPFPAPIMTLDRTRIAASCRRMARL